jgi:RNA polymerase-binding transcription factor DksA
LGKIEAGTYGKCNACGEEIPEARLDANPAALTCMEHTK